MFFESKRRQILLTTSIMSAPLSGLATISFNFRRFCPQDNVSMPNRRGPARALSDCMRGHFADVTAHKNNLKRNLRRLAHILQLT